MRNNVYMGKTEFSPHLCPSAGNSVGRQMQLLLNYPLKWKKRIPFTEVISAASKGRLQRKNQTG